MSVKTVTIKSFSTEDLSEYRGTWVAVRDGKVVASNADLDALLEASNVRSSDEISFVPEDSEATMFL
jgi:hypothetical protein